MKCKRILLVCLVLALAIACCGCAPEPDTPEQILEKMQAALAATPCSEARMVSDMSVTLDGGEYGKLQMHTKTTNGVKVSQNPISGYSIATVDVDYGGEMSQSITENYSVMEDGQLVSYLHSDGIWLRASTGQTAEGLVQCTSPAVEASAVFVDDTVTEYEGKTVICLTSRISGDRVQVALRSMLDHMVQQGGALEEASETAAAVDYSVMTCDVRIYLDKETYLPIAEEMTFDGMADVLNPVYAPMGIIVDAVSCSSFVEFLSYAPVEEIRLPEGAAEKAAAWARLLAGEPDNGDGTYTIREGSILVDIVPPEGFELKEKGYDHVYFRRDDYRQVRYTVYHSSADYFSAMMDRQLTRYGNLPKRVSRDQIPVTAALLQFDTEIVGVEWQSYEEALMYAWAELGYDATASYFIFIEVTDGYNDGLGNSKSADVTPEEFVSYLDAATPSDLLE